MSYKENRASNNSPHYLVHFKSNLNTCMCNIYLVSHYSSSDTISGYFVLNKNINIFLNENIFKQECI